MKSFILACDFFGFEPSLHIKSKKRFQSTFTGVISIFVGLISILCMGYFGSELLTRSTSTVIIASENLGEFGPVKISNKEFLFMMGVEDENYNYFVDQTIFEVNAVTQKIYYETLSDGTIEQKVENTKVKMDLCSKYYTPDDLQEKNLGFPLNLFFCSEPNAIEVGGYWGSKDAPYINMRVDFTKCKNTTENNFNCKNIEEINKIVQNSYISLDFTTFEVDPKNYTNPFKRMFFDEYNLLNANSSLEYSIDLFPLKLISDDGLMFENKNIFDGFLHNMRIFNRNTPSDHIVSLVFQGNPSARVYLRNYVKLQTILTQIGGFINSVVLLGTFISIFISKNYFFIQYLTEIVEESVKIPVTNINERSDAGLKSISKLRYENTGNLNNTILQLNIKKERHLNPINSFLNSHLNQKNNNLDSNCVNKNPSMRVDRTNKDLKTFDQLKSEKMRTTQFQQPYDPNQPKIKFRKKLYLVLLEYSLNWICYFRSYSKKSHNFKLVSGIRKIYEKALSVNNLIANSFELKLLKTELSNLIENRNLNHSLKLSIEENILTEAGIINTVSMTSIIK